MDNEEVIQNTGVTLPEDVILHIAQFLHDEDALALSLACLDVYETDPSIYWKEIQRHPKSISISQCYYLSDVSWRQELEHNTEKAKNLTAFDASHCFWLSVEVLLETLSRMPNLKQLLIHDTKITLAHLPQIFKSCQKLTKLSFTLAEKNLDAFTESKMGEEDFGWLLKGFKRLTHLKLFTYQLDPINCYVSSCWPVTFGVLRWCSRNCIDLFIEVDYPPTTRGNIPVNDVVNRIMQIPLADLVWLRSLKSLIVIARGSSFPKDNFVARFLNWFVQHREPNTFGRLWIESMNSAHSVQTLRWDNVNVPLTKSLLLWPGDQGFFDRDYVGLRQLENVGEVVFSKLANKPNLKYIRGHCRNAEGLSEFCIVHPMLKHLHFNTSAISETKDMDITVGEWSLPQLKTLVYCCTFPVKEIIDHLIGACPNIEAFHVGKAGVNCFDIQIFSQPIDNVNFLSAITFPQLTSLSFDGFKLFDGSYMPAILQQCPKLECLHLSGAAKPAKFLYHLGECLPNAAKLRDLRVQLYNREKKADVLGFLRKLRECSNHLERLVFVAEIPCDFTGPTAAAELRTFLTSFPLEMKRLVLICLAGIRLNSDDTDAIQQYWNEKVMPDRPGFRHFLGPDLPKGNNSAIPRIDMDEIVRPIDWFRSPPHFDDIDLQETYD